MKNFKLKITTMIAILVLSGVSCKDNFLQTVPQDRVSEAIYWKTPKDAQLAVNNLYNYLYNPVDLMNLAAVSDIAVGNGGFNIITRYSHDIETADGGFGVNQWNHNYKGIRACNEVLTNIGKIQTTDTELMNQYKAQARFMRAYLYLYLTEFFGNVPLITKPIDPKAASTVAQTDQSKVFDFIHTELQSAAKNLPTQYSNADKGRITKGAALALDARAMLNAGRYKEAAASAKAVMDLGIYSLYPSYKNLFTYKGEGNSGVILDKQFIQNDQPQGVYSYIAPGSLPQVGSDQEVVPTANIVNAFEMKNGKPITDPTSGFDPKHPYQNRDPRLHYSMFVYGDTLPNGVIYDPRPGFGGPDDINKGFGTTQTGFNIEKYVTSEDMNDPNNSGINTIEIRYAEVLLTYAEAKIELNQIDQSVYGAINEVRQRKDVNMPPITGSKTQAQMRQIVRNEREVELAFEGLRFFDIKRWKIAKNVMNGPVNGMTYVDKSGNVQQYVYPDFNFVFNNRDYLWPIPQQELTLNSNLKQNPGW
ncbi:MAG TPA: RagB/SusD family nutrient uptake outer membrane protein [Balneolales bacterium]|nr:RagB/SusD family nutrient uptake outer membrane protein [Balneolales bacterium]